MRPRLSLPVRLVAVILLVSGIVGLAHYLASRALMTDSLREIQTYHAKSAHALVTGDITQGIAHVREIAWLLKQRPDLAQAAIRAQVPRTLRRERLKAIIDSLGPLLGTNIIEIFDTDETVLYSTHPSVQQAERPGIWGVFEALSGDDVMVTAEDQGLIIRAIVPIVTPHGTEAALAVGMRINDDTLRNWVGTESMALVLVNAKGVMLASSAGEQPVDHAMLSQSLRSKNDVNHTHANDWTTTTYFGMAIVDQTYVWIARQDSSEVFTSFGHARRVELQISILLAAASALLLGWLAYRHARAIGALRHETETIITREFGEAAPRLHGSEIAQLAASVQLLEQRLVTRAHELRESYQAVEAASRSRNEFFASVSHELRTPINAILGYVHYARQHTGNPALDRDLKKVDTAATVLLGLVDDILDYAKIESGNFEIHPVVCDLDENMQTVVDLTAPDALQKGVEFIVDVGAAVPRRIVIDAMRLRQILVNLCSNAVKFTASGEIVLRAEILADTPRGPAIRFSILDTGIGMGEAQQARLFAPFTQGSSTAVADRHGAGLGLALCKRLVALMGGDITMHSVPGEGTTASVNFPFTPVTQVVATPRPGENGTVLVIAGNESLRRAIAGMLRGFDYAVLDATDASVARLAVAERGPQATKITYAVIDRSMAQFAQCILLLREVAPDAKVIALCDQRDNLDQQDNPHAEPVMHALVKPATRGSLRALLQPPAPRPALKSEDRGALLAGMRVLLAEDNLSNLEIAERALRAAGAEVVVAANGQEAVAAAAAQSFDAMVIDVQMPVMDGIEATRAIRAMGEEAGRAAMPIIGVTASAVGGDRESCIAAGMTEYVTKPIAPDQFVDIVARFARAARTVVSPAGRATSVPPALAGMTAAGFDVARGLILTGGQAQYMRTLDRFIAEAGQVVSRAHTLIAHGEITAAVREIHGITGSAALLGAQVINRAAVAAETAIFANAPERDQRLAELDDLLQQAARVLDSQQPRKASAAG